MREDAQLTFDKTNTEGLTLVGRKLRIQWAETKVKQNRTHALFSTPALALDAVNKLHAHVFKGSLLSVTLKKRLDILVSHKAPSANLRTTPSHAHRLIIRNIPFSATAQDLRSIFLPYEPIHSINVPLKEPVSPKSELAKAQKDEAQHDGGVPQTRPERNKGFAFVWFYSRKDAEKAMQERNGTVLRAGVAEELVKGKQKKKKERRMELKLAKGKVEVPVTEENDSDEDDAAAEANNTGKDKNERIMAVDWALSKDRWEEEKAKIEQVMADEDGNDDDVQSRSDQEESEGEQGGLGIHDHEGSDKESGNESGSDQSEQDGEEEERNQDDKPVKPHLPQPDVGTTLFIRNIPYDATEDELRTLFRAFGPLRYARITMDHATGRSRGTGFACFWNKEDADKVIEQSELLRAETTGNTMTVPKNNPFTLPSILTPIRPLLSLKTLFCVAVHSTSYVL
ncbi:hypothetical protein APHAL10511_000424 [Amanita phalloides]|nr:hypothetical protein APHAL10511_000424 [Amanita phalloides]